MLVCLSPHSDNFEESLSTLRFATQAKSIKTKAKVNERHSPEMMELLIKSLQKEVSKLKQQLRRSSTISIRRDGGVVKIANIGTQTVNVMMKHDDDEKEEVQGLLQQSGLSSLRDAMESSSVSERQNGLFSRLVQLHTESNVKEKDAGDVDVDNEIDDDVDDMFGSVEQVLRLKQENAVLKHRILDLEESIREEKEQEDEKKIESNTLLTTTSTGQDKALVSRIQELEQKLRDSESSRESGANAEKTFKT